MVMLQDDGLSKTYQMINESDKIFAIISASIKNLTTEENEKRIEQLIKDVYELGYRFTHMAGGYLENCQLKSGYGHSLFVPDIKKEDVLKLAKKYNQDIVIYKDQDGLKYYEQNGELEKEIKTESLFVGNSFDLDKIKPYFRRKINCENINQKELYIFAYEPWTLMGKHRAYLNAVKSNDFTSSSPPVEITGENKMNTKEMAEFFESEVKKTEEKQPVHQDEINEEVVYQYHTTTPIDEIADVGFGVEVHNEDDNNPNANQLKFAHFHWGGVHFKFSKNLPKNPTQLKQMIAFKRELDRLDDHELSRLVKILKSKPPINKFGKYDNVYEKALDYWMTLNGREIDYVEIEEENLKN